MSYNLKNIHWYQHLNNISLTLPNQGFVAIIGPNGAGKSTLMNLLSRWQQPTQGEITFMGKPLNRYKPLELARHMAWLPQKSTIAWDLTVRQVVELGGYAKRHILHQKTPAEKIDKILQSVELQDFTEHAANTLSGGEQSRMHLARLMASDTQYWLLDEFDAGLDWHHSLRLFELLKNHSKNKLIICIIHDLNIAKQIADKVILLNKGKLVDFGTATDVMTTAQLSHIWQTPITQKEDGWLAPQYPL
ncbi:MAG: ABC transporter ATP-binding protein [Alphaproteobacteria bacterium]